MNSLLRNIAAAIAAVIATGAWADVKELPVTTINGKLYHYYKVEGKESIYSVVHKLKVPKDELLRYNPGAIEGLKSGMTLYYPFDNSEVEEIAEVAEVADTPEAPPTPETPEKSEAPEKIEPSDNSDNSEPSENFDNSDTHLVQRGETIYGLARRYGVSEADLMKWNPSLADGLKADSRIIVRAPQAAAPDTVAPAAPAPVAPVSSVGEPVVTPALAEGYLVKEKETFYSIARDHGITVPELEAANPEVSLLKAGMVLNIPRPGDAVAVEPEPRPEENAAPQVTEPATEPAEEVAETPASDNVNIALILPFMTRQEPVSKQAMRFTEFYKGFLIAVDSLRRSGKPINILALDSHGSTDTVKHLLTRPDLKEMDVVIAPDNAAQLAYIARWGLENNVKVYNAFVIKDDTYVGNPMMLQSNIPSEMMLDKAADGLIASLGSFTPVIISRTGVEADKADFLKELEAKLKAKGITPVTIEFDNRLSASALSALDATGDYMFIPVTGKQAEVNRILPGLIDWHRSASAARVKVWGYPEWIAFRGETLQNMHALSTTIYSRFAPDEDHYRNKKFDAAFKRWYGSEMENATPRQGLLGFDTGMYLLRLGLLDKPAPSGVRYSGIQTDYDFRQVPDGGWVNNSLILVTYLPGGEISKTSK
ncbi:MAG: LysM peptidoglycan-binding domain-containing protein [Duncaniella sp.]|nr:LysM peptidoglycan-binding domain-containing protein [Duncaniella sp.]